MKVHRIVFGLALAAGISAAPSTAPAQDEGGGGGSLVESRKLETQAMTALNVAKKDVEKARLKVVGTFKTTQPDYAKAEADLAKAKTAMDAAKLAAQGRTRSQPEYRAAAAAKAAAQEKLNALRDERGLAADKERDALLAANMKNVTTINRLETAALTTDAGYADAKTRVAELTKVLEGFNAQIDEACKVDPEYMAAHAAMTMANDTYTQAKLATAQAQKAMAEAAKSERASKASERSSRSGKSE